jgi:secreted trypsin-like serine protease
MVRKAASAVVLGVLTVVLFGSQTPSRAADGAQPAHEIVGGNPAPAGRFPWMVRLSMGCGGALTAPGIVLTAGHCVTGSGRDDTIGVIAGTTDLESGAAIKAHSVSVIRPRSFRHETRGDDWALIKLDRRLDLPALALSRGGAEDTGPMTILGWGQTSEGSPHQQTRLRYAHVPIVGDEPCAQAYRTVEVQLVRLEDICAGRRGVDTCQGDSGGPMVRETADHRFVQVGIVSYGLGCARGGYPGVYTQVSTFRTDILRAASQLG